MDIEQHDDVMFRGKRLEDLTREELLDALRQALAEIKRLTLDGEA